MRELNDFLRSLLKSRIVPFVLILIVMATTLLTRLFSLQIINGEEYIKGLDASIKKTTSVAATRGRIFDKNGVLLAYNDLAYAVKISDSGTYPDNETKNRIVNGSIERTLNIIESKGDRFYNEFEISYNSDLLQYQFNVSGNSLLRFKRDSYGERKIADLSEEQINSTANEMVEYFIKQFEIDSDNIKPEHILEIIDLRLLMRANSYSRYISFTIANEVSNETVAAILENSDDLVGVTVDEQYIRRYVDSIYCSQIIGYTGTISSDELEKLNATDSYYENNDVVGKTGIEQALESELSGTKGKKTIYVDTVGRVTQVLEETDAQAGNDVYLTIDINLQKKYYYAIEDQLVKTILNYISKDDKKYEYNEYGKISTVYITQNDIYFALINNNIISLKDIENGESQTAQRVYNSFLNKKERVFDWIKNQLTVNPTPYSDLSDEQRAYIWYIYNDLLLENKIFNKDNVDASDTMYKEWNEGNSISLEEFLKYSISNNWIDMSVLTDLKYSSLSETYDVLVKYIFDALETDTSLHKKMYKYLIETKTVSGTQLCMLLFEHGILTDQGDEYISLARGTITPLDFMKSVIKTKRLTPAQLALKPCSGSVVAVDPNNGDVIALVSYPSYDNNMLSGTVDNDYYYKIYNDNSLPLRNWATQTQYAPGSTFKIVTAIAGLELGVVDKSTTYYCNGVFDKVYPNPLCHYLAGHKTETITDAIRDSCNIYFYNIGYKLAFLKDGTYNSSHGTSILQKYAEDLGLATTSGIEIYEATPYASNTNAIASAIGQGTHSYSCLNLARYTATIANSGTCYNLTLVDKITDQYGNLIKDNQATVANKVEIDNSIWDTVHEGMLYAAQVSPLGALPFATGAKTGTAQGRTTEPDHALVIAYAPYEKPEIAVSVTIPNGYASIETCDLTNEILSIYFDNNNK